MPIEIPKSMQTELKLWNAGRGISIEDWIGCVGNVDLALGYSTIFWPKFELVGQYILTEGWKAETVAGFEKQPNHTPQGLEWVMNHRHIVDIHCDNEVVATVDHVAGLGAVLKEMYEAKLSWQFPDRPCEVEFYIPEDPDNLVEYQVSFWQKKWAKAKTP